MITTKIFQQGLTPVATLPPWSGGILTETDDDVGCGLGTYCRTPLSRARSYMMLRNRQVELSVLASPSVTFKALGYEPLSDYPSRLVRFNTRLEEIRSLFGPPSSLVKNERRVFHVNRTGTLTVGSTPSGSTHISVTYEGLSPIYAPSGESFTPNLLNPGTQSWVDDPTPGLFIVNYSETLSIEDGSKIKIRSSWSGQPCANGAPYYEKVVVTLIDLVIDEVNLHPEEGEYSFGALVQLRSRCYAKVVRHVLRDVSSGDIVTSYSSSDPTQIIELESEGLREVYSQSNLGGGFLLQGETSEELISQISRGYSPHFNEYRALCEVYQDDIMVAGYFAQSAALDSFTGNGGSNLLESLIELEDILSVFDYKDLVINMIRHLTVKGVPNLRILRSLLEAVASGHLLWAFGIRPSVKQVDDIGRVSRSAILALDEATGVRVARGTYVYEFGSNEAFFGERLRAQSKVLVGVPEDTFLIGLIPLESFGLLPSLSRVWDILPSSFIVDWFFNIGDKLSVLDSFAKSLILECRGAINSVRVTRALLPEELPEEYLTSTAVYSFYRREVYGHTQPFSPTRIGFLSGGARVPLGLLTSLSYLRLQ